MVGYADYIIILSPSESVCEQVKEHKYYAGGIIGTVDNQSSKAQITIKPMPRRKPYMAEPEIRSLKTQMAPLPPVSLTVDGFDFFSHGTEFRTIYAKIRTDHQTTAWFKALKKALKIKDYLVPHISIARNIATGDHNKLWPHFKKLCWVEDFEADRLTILRRQAFDNFANWQVYMEIPFEARSLPSTAPPKESLLQPLSGSYAASQQMSLF